MPLAVPESSNQTVTAYPKTTAGAARTATALPVVWEVLECYLPRTETFVYTALTNLQKTSPVVISYDPAVNQEEFPIGPRPLFCMEERLKLPRYFWRRVLTKLGGRDWHAFAEAREARAIAGGNPPSVIHAHFGPVGYRALTLKRSLGAPLVTTFYGYDTNPAMNRTGWARQRQELFAEGDLFLVEGPFMRSRLIELGCPAERIEIQRIGIDPARMPALQEKARRSAPVVLFAARFVEKKGTEYGLEAMARLHRSGYQFDCRIIGNGPLEQKMRSIVAANQMQNVVRFLGSVSYEEYLEELRNADIFVQPSVTAADGDCEGGAPTTLLEAQYYGLPVVSTLHADIPNIVVPNQSGVLVKERDSEALAQALAGLFERPQSWPEMGRTGQNFVIQNHSVENLSRRLEDMYLNLTRFRP
jgi:colanic acid/amylovoran biosynthesis glycosyltransferase